MQRMSKGNIDPTNTPWDLLHKEYEEEWARRVAAVQAEYEADDDEQLEIPVPASANADAQEDTEEDEPSAKRARSETLSRAALKHGEDMRILSMLIRGCDVMEVFSPQRVGQVCHEFNLVPGPALDLRTGYDFSKAVDRARAMPLYHDTTPEMTILSPLCTEFSRLQSLNRGIHGEK